MQNSLGEVLEEAAKVGDSLLNNSDNSSIFELEEVLKQRMFTRFYFFRAVGFFYILVGYIHINARNLYFFIVMWHMSLILSF